MKIHLARIKPFWPILPILVLASSPWMIPLHNVKLSELAGRVSGQEVIGVFNETRSEKDGILLLRLSDAKEQFLPGQWIAHFMQTGNLSLLAVPTSTEATSTLFLNVRTDGQVAMTKTGTIPGRVSDVQENEDQTYFSFFYDQKDSKRLCLMERTQNIAAVCSNASVPEPLVMAWNPKAEHELFVRTATGSVYIVDPWEKAPVIASAIKTHRQLLDIDEALTPRSRSHTEIMAPIQKQFWKIYNLAIIQGSNGWSFYRVPPNATLAWLPGGERLLAKESDQISIIDLPSRSQAVLIKEKDIGTKPILYRNSWGGTL